MSLDGNDIFSQGKLVSKASYEAVDARHGRHDEPDRKFRDAGWWPSSSTVLKAVFIGIVVIIGIGWALTLLK